MHKLTVNINNKNYEFTHPSCFAELTTQQFIKVTELVFLPEESIFLRQEDRIKLLYELLSGNKKIKYKIIASLIDSEDVITLLDLHIFTVTHTKFNTWNVKELTYKRNKISGPSDRFSDMTFGEFIILDTLANAYSSDNEKKAILDDFFSFIMRNSIKGTRQPFDDNREFKFIDKVDYITKIAVFYNFLAIREWISEKYTNVFPQKVKKDTTHIDFNSKKTSGWMDIRRQIAESVFNLKKVDNLLLHEVLSDFNYKLSKND